jgi:hypothetical protein
MYDTYSGNYAPTTETGVVPEDNPYGFGNPRVTGWRTGRPTSWGPVPDAIGMSDEEMESADVGIHEGGGHLYPYQAFAPPYDETGANARSGHLPPWQVSGYVHRAIDQGGAAANREVAGSDVITDSNGMPVGSAATVDFTNKSHGDVAVYYQEPADSYFEMGPYAYPGVNPPRNNTRASARSTDDARVDIPVRIPGAKQKTYVLSTLSQEAMQPVSYRQSWGAIRRPFAPGRIASTIGTINGVPEWSQYSNQPSPAGFRTPPIDASQEDYDAQEALSDGYSPEDVSY